MKSLAEIMDALPKDWPYRHLLPATREVPPTKKPRPEPGPRSLRDLASVSSAFDQWEEEEEP